MNERLWRFLKELSKILTIFLTPVLGLLLFVTTYYPDMIPDRLVFIVMGIAVINAVLGIVAHAKA